ncbi:hypothetical protein ACFVYA_41435 [Amycolatopsis sp. NPDC058278]|uniref:hypothetical protein n=1 Tax=Amycolatopsis sp. NPDC058278 TaxID=3346417 RepID=UPI0036DDE5A7
MKLGRVVGVHHPLAHIGSVFGLLMAVTQGRKASLLGRFEPRAWAELVAEHQIVVNSLPSAAIHTLLDADVPKEKPASLPYLGAGTAPVAARGRG